MTRILVADDHAVVREGIRRILEEEGGFTVAAEAADGNAVLEILEAGEFDVVLLDVSMPGPGFLEILRRIRERRPSPPVVILSMHSEDQYALRAFRAGASAYVTKDRSPEELATAIRVVLAGGRFTSPSLARRILDGDGDRYDRPPHEALSDREYQVLCRLGSGETVKTIATALTLSPKTVSTYRARLLAKLGLKGTADLVRYALEHDLRP